MRVCGSATRHPSESQVSDTDKSVTLRVEFCTSSCSKTQGKRKCLCTSEGNRIEKKKSRLRDEVDFHAAVVWWIGFWPGRSPDSSAASAGRPSRGVRRAHHSSA